MGLPGCATATQHRRSGVKAATDRLEVNECGCVPAKRCWQTLKCEFHIKFHTRNIILLLVVLNHLKMQKKKHS